MINKKTRGFPVEGFDIEFEWQANEWVLLLDAQAERIGKELACAVAEDRFVVYLSCPIIPRAGGDSSTNVAIADFTAERLGANLGRRVFVLNPAAYQMQSKHGRELLEQHSRLLKAERTLPFEFDLGEFARISRPRSGDYMRMWTRVLVEDDSPYVDRKQAVDGVVPLDHSRRGKNCGGLFDAFYFLGPGDVRAFFMRHGAESLASGIEEYFDSRYRLDRSFRDIYNRLADAQALDFAGIREDFVRYYGLRAGAMFSRGARGEWNIWNRLNEKRRRDPAYGRGEEIAGYWDGGHVDPVSAILMPAPNLRTSPAGRAALLAPEVWG